MLSSFIRLNTYFFDAETILCTRHKTGWEPNAKKDYEEMKKLHYTQIKRHMVKVHSMLKMHTWRFSNTNLGM